MGGAAGPRAARPGRLAVHWYDFDDDWHHTIELEQVMPRGRGEPYCRLVGGRRAAPPDDCGGVWGYQELLEAIGDPQHPRHEELSEWFEDFGWVESAATYDPAHVDLPALASQVLDLST